MAAVSECRGIQTDNCNSGTSDQDSDNCEGYYQKNYVCTNSDGSDAVCTPYDPHCDGICDPDSDLVVSVNSCAEGSAIKSIDDCKKAADNLHATYKTVTEPSSPKNCYQATSTNDVYFNTYATCASSWNPKECSIDNDGSDCYYGPCGDSKCTSEPSQSCDMSKNYETGYCEGTTTTQCTSNNDCPTYTCKGCDNEGVCTGEDAGCAANRSENYCKAAGDCEWTACNVVPCSVKDSDIHTTCNGQQATCEESNVPGTCDPPDDLPEISECTAFSSSSSCTVTEGFFSYDIDINSCIEVAEDSSAWTYSGTLEEPSDPHGCIVDGSRVYFNNNGLDTCTSGGYNCVCLDCPLKPIENPDCFLDCIPSASDECNIPYGDDMCTYALPNYFTQLSGTCALPIESPEACEVAADAMNMSYDGSYNREMTSGCYTTSSLTCSLNGASCETDSDCSENTCNDIAVACGKSECGVCSVTQTGIDNGVTEKNCNDAGTNPDLGGEVGCASGIGNIYCTWVDSSSCEEKLSDSEGNMYTFYDEGCYPGHHRRNGHSG